MQPIRELRLHAASTGAQHCLPSQPLKAADEADLQACMRMRPACTCSCSAAVFWPSPALNCTLGGAGVCPGVPTYLLAQQIEVGLHKHV